MQLLTSHAHKVGGCMLRFLVQLKQKSHGILEKLNDFGQHGDVFPACEGGVRWLYVQGCSYWWRVCRKDVRSQAIQIWNLLGETRKHDRGGLHAQDSWSRRENDSGKNKREGEQKWYCNCNLCFIGEKKPYQPNANVVIKFLFLSLCVKFAPLVTHLGHSWSGTLSYYYPILLSQLTWSGTCLWPDKRKNICEHQEMAGWHQTVLW